jgi:hypothetical protein
VVNVYWFILHEPTILHPNKPLTALPARAVVQRGRSALLQRLARSYLHLAGAQAAYDFYAPDVPDCYRLKFDIHYADGSVDHQMLRAQSKAGALRIATFSANVAMDDYLPLRKVLLKMAASSIWRRHSQVEYICATLERGSLPAVNDRKLPTISFAPLESYDFKEVDLNR